MGKVAGSSYDWDDRKSLLHFLHGKKDKQFQNQKEGTTVLPPSEDNIEDVEGLLSITVPYQTMAEKEKTAFYFVCGYVVHKVLQENADIKNCPECHTSLLHQGPHAHRYGLFIQLTSFSSSLLKSISEEAFQLCLKAEEDLVRKRRLYNLQDSNHMAILRQEILNLRTDSLPTCHSVHKILLERFFLILMRSRLGIENTFADSSENSVAKVLQDYGSQLLSCVP